METNNELVEKKVALKETKEDEHLISRTLEMSQDNILINNVRKKQNHIYTFIFGYRISNSFSKNTYLV